MINQKKVLGEKQLCLEFLVFFIVIIHIGSFAGVGMGLFFGTFEGAHGDILGNTSYERIKYASKRLLKICWRMSYRYAYVLIQNIIFYE